MPGGDLLEVVGAATLAHFVLGEARVDPDRAKLVLVRIVAQLTVVVCSAGPQLAPIRLPGVVREQQRVVLTAADLMDRHALECCHHRGRLNDPVAVSVTQAQLSLVSVTAAVDLV